MSIKIPVLIFTALGTIDDNVIDFEVGVEDYLVKLFEYRERFARVNALYKRSTDTNQQENIFLYKMDNEVVLT